MNLKCLLGAHKWSGCKCSKCGKTHDESHDWAVDCEKCAKCGKTQSGAHTWSGCRCSKCGKTRDESHDWAADCEKCAKCGKTRGGEHAWSGCKCSKCGWTRDESHDWAGCKCNKCGKTRDQEHNFNGCKCSTCNRVRATGHSWQEGRCVFCGGAYTQMDLDHAQNFLLLCPGLGSSMTARRAFSLCVDRNRYSSVRIELAELTGTGPGGIEDFVAICGRFNDSTRVLPDTVIHACEFGIDDLRYPVRRREYLRRLIRVLDSWEQ